MFMLGAGFLTRNFTTNRSSHYQNLVNVPCKLLVIWAFKAKEGQG